MFLRTFETIVRVRLLLWMSWLFSSCGEDSHVTNRSATIRGAAPWPLSSQATILVSKWPTSVCPKTFAMPEARQEAWIFFFCSPLESVGDAETISVMIECTDCARRSGFSFCFELIYYDQIILALPVCCATEKQIDCECFVFRNIDCELLFKNYLNINQYWDPTTVSALPAVLHCFLRSMLA